MERSRETDRGCYPEKPNHPELVEHEHKQFKRRVRYPPEFQGGHVGGRERVRSACVIPIYVIKIPGRGGKEGTVV